MSARNEHALPEPEALHHCIGEVSKLADKAGVRLALIGCLATQHYGHNRFANEVEIAASGPISGLTAKKKLATGGYMLLPFVLPVPPYRSAMP